MATGTPGAAAPRTPRKTAAAPPTHAGHTTSGATGAGSAPTQKSLEQHLVTVAEGEVMSPTDLYEWLESLRALCSGLSFMVHAGASQLEAAARKGAKDSTDGRLTLKQKMELAVTLKRMGKRLDNGAAEDLLTAATSAVKTYSLLQDFLDNVESDTVSRPHRNQRGGFNLGL